MKTESPDRKSQLGQLKKLVRDSRFGRLFLDRKFFHYTLVGVSISVLNIFLLWLLIDVLNIPTVISSTLVIGATFILRYVIFRVLGIM